MGRRLLLISSSKYHGTAFLEHCLSAIEDHLDGRKLLFVPYALADHDAYHAIVQEALRPIGIEVESIHNAECPLVAMESAEAIFVGGGNSFRLLKTLYGLGLVELIRDQVLNHGVPYMGSSAGTNITCPTIRTTNDMPIVQPPTFDSLNLIPFQINPHYLDPDPNSKHQGETREVRLLEYHEENDLPVLAIREGSWVQVRDDSAKLCGLTPARFFQRGKDREELPPGTDLSFLL